MAPSFRLPTQKPSPWGVRPIVPNPTKGRDSDVIMQEDTTTVPPRKPPKPYTPPVVVKNNAVVVNPNHKANLFLERMQRDMGMSKVSDTATFSPRRLCVPGSKLLRTPLRQAAPCNKIAGAPY